MLKKVMCTTCSEPHIDHYECDACHGFIGGLYLPGYTRTPAMGGSYERPWRYCPWCGSELRTSDEELRITTYPYNVEKGV